MRAKNIPELIFEDLVKAFKVPIKEMKKYQDVYSVIILEDFKSAVGLYINKEDSSLRVWEYPFKTDSDDRLPEEDPVIKITGKPHSAGIWAYGRGELLLETVMVTFGVKAYMHGIRLENPLIFLIGIILSRGAQIADSNLKEISYWQSFLNPDMDYTEP